MKNDLKSRALRLVVFSIIFLVACAVPLTANSVNVQEQVENRSKEDIIRMWKQYLPLKWGDSYGVDQDTFEIVPSAAVPYKLGKVKLAYLEDGLNAVNFARYLAGLPHDVELDWSLEEQQQAGALINAINKNLSHYPERPSNMSDELFALAAESASTSNLSMGRAELYNTIFKGYMSDNSSYSNLDSVGHRRWIINPQLKKTMFGVAGSVSDSTAFGDRTYSSMYAFNRDRPLYEVEYDYIAWPSAGYFPAEVFSGKDPWSVSLNPELYDRSYTSDITVKVTRERDQKVWNLNHKSRDYDGDLFNIDLKGYGINFAVIFRPGHIESYQNDDIFHIEIAGLRTVYGETTTLKYSTHFFQLQPEHSNRNDMNIKAGEKVKLSSPASSYRIHDENIAFIDAEGNIVGRSEGSTRLTRYGYLYQPATTITIHVVADKPVQVSEWAKQSYQEALAAGLVYGTPPEKMDTVVTRATFVNYAVNMIAVLQGKEFGELKPNFASPFKDVPSSEASIIWAYENKIIEGTGGGMFSPNDKITREQAAKLLLNVHQYLSGEAASEVAAVTFKDEAQIANWAKIPVRQAVALKLLTGVSADQFDPKGNYTHEQTIVTLLRIYNMFN